MKVSIASDHAGFDEKQLLIPYLQELGYEVIDRGPESADRVDYPDYAALVAKDVEDDEAERGVLICGTGIGMAMTADKVPGVRATVVQTNKFAELCREHNDCNVLCLSGRFTAPMDNCQFVETFLTTEFGGGRHEGRVAKIMAEDER